MLDKVQKSAVLFLAIGLMVAPAVFSQEADLEAYGEEFPDDYCSNIGTVKNLTDVQLVLDGINWDLEAAEDTVEVTYAIDADLGVELDGYEAMADIQVGDMIGLECEKRDGKEFVTFIQSEEALNRDMEEFAEIQEELSQIDMQGLTGSLEEVDAAAEEGLDGFTQEPVAGQ